MLRALYAAGVVHLFFVLCFFVRSKHHPGFDHAAPYCTYRGQTGQRGRSPLLIKRMLNEALTDGLEAAGTFDGHRRQGFRLLPWAAFYVLMEVLTS